MYIKTHKGDGVWDLFEVADGALEFTSNNCYVEVCGTQDEVIEYTFWDDKRFPTVDGRTIHYYPVNLLLPDGGSDTHKAMVHWAKFTSPSGQEHMLISTEPFFIMNGQGDTVETLR